MENNILPLNAKALALKIEELKTQISELQTRLDYKMPSVDTTAKEKLLLILGIARVCLEEESFSKEAVMWELNRAIDLLNSLK